MFQKIPGNGGEDSRECPRRFQEMLKKILGNVSEDSGERSKRFRGMLKKIPGNVPEDPGECLDSGERFRGLCMFYTPYSVISIIGCIKARR